MKNLSNTHVANPEDRVRFNQAIHCRIIKIEPERFSFEATSRSSDLKDEERMWRPQKDPYYDYDTEQKQIKAESDKNKLKIAQTYIKRVIVHPCFHNVSFAEGVKLLHNSDQGDAIIRPSSKGADHFTVTWKVADNVFQHIDVQEKGKVNAFSLGRSLWIGTEEFEDLDEIIARHITPMAGNARELLRFKYYRDTDGGNIEKAEKILGEEKANNPLKINYIVSVSQVCCNLNWLYPKFLIYNCFYRNMQANFFFRVYLLVDQNMNILLLHLKVIVTEAKISILLVLCSGGIKNISEMLHPMLHQ